MERLTEFASKLRFPEGPIAMPDGSVLLVEIERGTLSRALPTGKVEVVAFVGGGPNGAAIGPDGACYICNNGGFKWREKDRLLIPILQSDHYVGGSIQRVDLSTGAVSTMYGGAEGPMLKGPNDLVFDAQGGFWFSDLGKGRARSLDRSSVYYAKADGSSIREVIFPMMGANGVGLSPDGSTLYVAETITARLWAFDIIAPGEVRLEPWPSPNGGRLVTGSVNYWLFDSLAVERDGNICIGTLMNGGITVVAPDGRVIEHVAMPDLFTTNLCFGGPDMQTAFITLSTSGRLVSMKWPRPGARLMF